MIFDYPYTDMHELNLDWFLAKFKELVENWNSVESEWNSLHDYVQDYFENLNVQTEINNKINAMILDGTFADIVSPFVTAALPALVAGQLPDVVAAQISAVVAAQISAVVADQLPAVAAAAAAAEVGDWLAAHIDPDTGYVIDDTLTVSNAAADAETVGIKVNMLNNAIFDNAAFLKNTEIDGHYVLTADDLESGTRNVTALIADNTRLRSTSLLYVKKDTTVRVRNSNTDGLEFYLALTDINMTSYVSTFSGWHAQSALLYEFKMPSDGYLNVILRFGSQTAITTSDFLNCDINIWQPSIYELTFADLNWIQGTFDAGGQIVSNSKVVCNFKKITYPAGNYKFVVNDGYRVAIYTTDYTKADYLIGDAFNLTLETDTGIRCKVIKLSNEDITVTEVRNNVKICYSDPRLNLSDDQFIKLRMATFNVGHFSHGTSSTPAGTSHDVQPFRTALADLNADIMTIAENDPYFDAASQMPIYDTLYKLYSYYKSGNKNAYACNAVLSRYPILATYEIPYTDRQQAMYFYDCCLNINNRILHVIATHLDWYDIDMRTSQINQLIAYCADFDHVIIGGDFNPGGRVNGEYPGGVPVGHWEEDYQLFTDAGYDSANCGYFGVFSTFPTSPWLPAPLDNIFVKGGKVTWTQMQTPTVSDHYPLVCDIILY